MGLIGLLAVLAVLAWAPAWLAVLLLAAGGVWWLARDVRRYPRRPCRRCGGEGDFSSPLYRRWTGKCTCCRGRGTHPRRLLRITSRDTYDDIAHGRRTKY